ncbi:MAG: hypothetical protein H7Y38_08595 [Armatimonadetes bacterium]|nr:hypothetical protein [Armatimonadota bacterium]
MFFRPRFGRDSRAPPVPMCGQNAGLTNRAARAAFDLVAVAGTLLSGVAPLQQSPRTCLTDTPTGRKNSFLLDALPQQCASRSRRALLRLQMLIRCRFVRRQLRKERRSAFEPIKRTNGRHEKIREKRWTTVSTFCKADAALSFSTASIPQSVCGRQNREVEKRATRL